MWFNRCRHTSSLSSRELCVLPTADLESLCRAELQPTCGRGPSGRTSQTAWPFPACFCMRIRDGSVDVKQSKGAETLGNPNHRYFPHCASRRDPSRFSSHWYQHSAFSSWRECSITSPLCTKAVGLAPTLPANLTDPCTFLHDGTCGHSVRDRKATTSFRKPERG